MWICRELKHYPRVSKDREILDLQFVYKHLEVLEVLQ